MEMDNDELLSSSCPLEEHTCPAEPHVFNSTLWGLSKFASSVSEQEKKGWQIPRRQNMYSLFRRSAMAPPGYGIERHLELRNLLNEKSVDSWLIWMIAMPTVLSLSVCSQLILSHVFGTLRTAEKRHTRERMWNYAFYKFIFIFGVVNVESVEEMIIWLTSFIVLGYLHFFLVVSRDRCEYLTFSPSASSTVHRKIVGLLLSVALVSSAILVVSAFLFWNGLFHTSLFIAAEGAVILLQSWQIILKYGYQQFQQRRSFNLWDKKHGLLYYTNFFVDVGVALIDLLHHSHMMFQVCNLSASSLVIASQIRSLFFDLVGKINRHRNCLRIRHRLQEAYPSASFEEMKDCNNHCSICWDKMETARKLSCGHIFHELCILSWLEQDVSCPICRVALTPVLGASRVRPRAPEDEDGARFYYFNGSRFNRWLPNVSVTVQRANRRGNGESMEGMVEQVRTIFPNTPDYAILRDLLETGSVEATVDNILAGTIDLTPPPAQVPRDQPAAHPVSSGDAPTPTLTMMNIGGSMREIPDTPEACRALQIQRKETLVYEARRRYMEKLAKEKAANS